MHIYLFYVLVYINTRDETLLCYSRKQHLLIDLEQHVIEVNTVFIIYN